MVIWRQRHQIQAWRTRRTQAARQRAAERATRAAENAYQRQLTAHQKSYASYQAADATWKREQGHLIELANFAKTSGQRSTPPDSCSSNEEKPATARSPPPWWKMSDGAAHRGERSLDYAEVLDNILAPTYLRVLFSVGGIDDQYLTGLVDRLLT